MKITMESLRVPRILIIDDEQMMVELLKTVLEMDGYKVTTANAAEQAQQAVSKSPPDLLLVDYNLKSGDGLDVVRWMRSKRRFRRIPIIVTSGMEREDEALTAGADQFLLKPFDISELTVYIQRLIS